MQLPVRKSPERAHSPLPVPQRVWAQLGYRGSRLLQDELVKLAHGDGSLAVVLQERRRGDGDVGEPLGRLQEPRGNSDSLGNMLSPPRSPAADQLSACTLWGSK